MNSKRIDTQKVHFERATEHDCEPILRMIHRCLREVNAIDYSETEIERQCRKFNREWFGDTLENKHYYIARYHGVPIACGGVSMDEQQKFQCFFSAVFVDPDYIGRGIGAALIRFLEEDEWCRQSNLIELSSSLTAHGFYRRLGYRYRENPPIFRKDGVVMMYREKEANETW